MQNPVVIIRHPKEKIAKCSLRNLHDREGFEFFKAHPDFHFDASGHLLLTMEGPPLSQEDRGHPLLLLDSTWRLLPQLLRCLRGNPLRRSIPTKIRTAYPRFSKLTPDPPQGLASIEALYVAKRILGDDDPSLLEGYYWKDSFLKQFSLRNQNG